VGVTFVFFLSQQKDEQNQVFSRAVFSTFPGVIALWGMPGRQGLKHDVKKSHQERLIVSYEDFNKAHFYYSVLVTSLKTNRDNHRRIFLISCTNGSVKDRSSCAW